MPRVWILDMNVCESWLDVIKRFRITVLRTAWHIAIVETSTAWAIDNLRRHSGTNRIRILLVLSLVYAMTDHFMVTSVSIRRTRNDSDDWHIYAFPTPVRIYAIKTWES